MRLKGNLMEKAITIELHGHEMDDGRTYIDSRDLKGFHYVLEDGQDIEEIMPELSTFISLYLKAEIRKLVPAQTPRDFIQRSHGAHANRRSYPFVAEIEQGCVAA